MCILRKTTRRQVRTKQVLMIMPKSILLICAGFISLAVFHFSQIRIPLDQYQFEYSVYETIGNTNVSTHLVKCAVFDEDTMPLDEVKRRFIEYFDVGSELVVRQGCDKSLLSKNSDSTFRPVVGPTLMPTKTTK